MGKGKRTGAISALEKQIAEQQAQINAKRKKKKTIITAVVSVVLVVAIALGTFLGICLTDLSKGGYFARKKIAVSTENHVVDICMMQYFFNIVAQQYAEEYSDYLESVGLDTSKDFKEQKCYYDQTKTWYDYFSETAVSQVKEMLVLCEAADKAGIKLDESDERYLDLIKDSIDTNSAAAGYTTTEFLKTSYGKWVTEEVLLDCLRLNQLATKYQLNYQEKLEYTDSDINTYFENNKADLLTADYIYYPVANETDAKKISTSKTTAQFKENLENYIKKALKSADSSLSDDEIEDKTEEELKNSEVNDAKYDTSSTAGEWVFSEERKTGDVTYIKSENTYYIYYILTPAQKNTSATVSVRHILLPFEDNESDSASLKTKANRLLREWRNGKKNEQSFAELAKLNTYDTGSLMTGGLYKNIENGTMVDEFNEWIFSSKRKSGDTDVIKTDYGYHVMYFVGAGEPVWKADTISAFKSTSYSSHVTDLEQKYEVKENEKNIYAVNQIIANTDTDSDTTVSATA